MLIGFLVGVAVVQPQQWLPGQVGRYRNTDPVLINYLIRLAVEQRMALWTSGIFLALSQLTGEQHDHDANRDDPCQRNGL